MNEPTPTELIAWLREKERTATFGAAAVCGDSRMPGYQYAAAADLIERLQAEVERSQRHWTRNAPTTDGFYWWIRHMDGWNSSGAVVQVMGEDAFYLGQKRNIKAQGGWWCGPLTPPPLDLPTEANTQPTPAHTCPYCHKPTAPLAYHEGPEDCGAAK